MQGTNNTNSISQSGLQKLELTISLATLDAIFKNSFESQFGTNPTTRLQAVKKHSNLLSGLGEGKTRSGEGDRENTCGVCFHLRGLGNGLFA